MQEQIKFLLKQESNSMNNIIYLIKQIWDNQIIFNQEQQLLESNDFLHKLFRVYFLKSLFVKANFFQISIDGVIINIKQTVINQYFITFP
ncbi:hypothetical protein pb186bvf_006597 [Paramecium bursaria]